MIFLLHCRVWLAGPPVQGHTCTFEDGSSVAVAVLLLNGAAPFSFLIRRCCVLYSLNLWLLSPSERGGCCFSERERWLLLS